MTHLLIDLLGPLQVSVAGESITTMESVKVRALLAYLVVEANHIHSRASLIGLLWPDYPEEFARHNLRQALYNLREILGDQTAENPYLLVTRDTIQFNHASDYSLDIDQFNQCFRTVKESFSANQKISTTDASILEEMVKLYRGEFLQQLTVDDSTEFEEWLLAQREIFHQQILEVHGHLTNYYELCTDFQAARRHATRQLELDPWREEAHRQLMRLLAMDGQRSSALVQYETCKKILADELDVEPSAETRELYEQIKLGNFEIHTHQIRSLPSLPVNNLPVQLTPFIGREAELNQLAEILADPECRCLTLVGPGGIGKTRLAMQVASNYLDKFAQGVAFVPLASVGSGAGILPTIMNAVNFSPFGPGDPKTYLLDYLSEKQMLIVMDNVEQLLNDKNQPSTMTQIVTDILQTAPKIKLLVTTREALNMQQEYIYAVTGLVFPDTTQKDRFDEFDAVKLFIQRSRRVVPQFTPNPENQVDIAQICRLVEGMPLAIELAATWMRVLSPSEIAVEIVSSLDILSTTVRDLPERHRNIRAVFDHSWQMLSADEQQVLSMLSVFRGGFSRQAAEQVTGASLTVLSTLVNRTMLRLASAGRYDLHELVRQYCAAKLAVNPQAKLNTQTRHYAYYLAMADQANQELQGRNQLDWLSRLEQDHDNLQVALEWSLDGPEDEPGNDERALLLASDLRWFWRMRGHFHEGCKWLELALQRYPLFKTEARARALLGLALLRNGLGDLSNARLPAEESVTIFRELGENGFFAEALMIEGLTLLWQGEAALGRSRTREALTLYRKIGDRWGEAQALYRLGSYLADYSGDPKGRSMLEESTTILEALHEKYLYTSVLISLGIVELSQGNYVAALPRFERGLSAAKEIRHPWGIADALTNLGCLYRIKADYVRAQDYFEEALKVYQEQGRNIWQTDVLCAMAENAI
ncbi:MAG TPA: BTAD domain-containing putative transcriptional regulator, partial [Anaerolineales bacterium]|nr:BTAD domain-containing putative transcriptional regulator [Anaerolineales bacterium]